ncbi:telomere length regulation protein TEL2 homolog [Contarinia nasturtii]|uniref:telomere length regulation protein TEL2 homolog n=1 Tax=Contarinia nasturtii TaxID=265458 RepID=UPI0012D38E1D|nr:telomere length regulation protein TEL2 homolog [Contarinia nasturtii]XP_031632875.1 telomere length regulation protein TEL2 homolog [Contarinia nasturtii]XP_031632876.1 telomere length regulation protein TEL2 homolog [Contarinia nasturtii]
MVDKFISMWKVREIADKVTNVVMNYTEIEGKVREATNDEPWGPTGPLMQELAHSTFTYEHFPEVMSMLWKRMLQDNKTNWRRTYKSLLLLNYLVRNGSERVVTSSREHIYDLRSLENYTFTDENGKDQGINVRHKVRELIDFIQDDDKLREERKKAKKNKDKYIGMSSDAMGMRMSSSSGGSAYNDWDSHKNDRKNSYEDDYHYDGEREDSDVDSSDPPSTRRYRDKERTESTPAPPAAAAVVTTTPRATTPRATTPSEIKKSTINVTVNPKSLSSNQLSTKSKNISKKIDMGAATNFGRDELGINSPTHRNTHAEEDLFSTSNIINTSTANKSDLDDIFKTCSTTNNLVSDPVSSQSKRVEDDFFNPRADESQEFGDFASAFGTSSATVQPTTPLPQEQPENNALVDSNDTKKNEFADFSSAFEANHQTSSNTTNDPANLLFAINSTSNAQTTASNSNQKVGDLLSDLDGLSLDVSVPTVSSTAENNAIITKDTTDNKSTINHRDAISKLLESLQSIEKLQSINDVDRVNSIVDQLLMHLPGPVTPEKLCRIDVCANTNWQQIAEFEYAIAQNELIRLFDDEWPIKMQPSSNNQSNIHIMPNVLNLFSIDHSMYFVKTTVYNIFKAENNVKFDKLMHIFEMCIRNECWLLATFVDFCYDDENETKPLDYDEERDQFIQLLIAAPNKIANYFMGKHSSLFDPERYSCIILLALTQALYFITETNRVERRTLFGTKFLGQLFGRIAVDFNLNRTSKVLPEIFRVMSLLAKRSDDFKTIVQQMLLQIHGESFDIVAWYALNTINPNDLLGDAVNTSDDWGCVLKSKIPLSPPGGVTDDFIRTFIGYLSKNLSADEKCTVLENVAKKWSSKLSLKINSIDQHLYFTKVLVHGAERFELKQSKQFTEKLSLIIHNGVRNHMDLLDEKMRAIGMITAEIILNKFNNHDDDESKLQFDYDGFAKEAREIVEAIKNFNQYTEPNEMQMLNDNDLEHSITSLYDIVNEKEAANKLKEMPYSKPSTSSQIQNTAFEIGSLGAAQSKAGPVLATPKPILSDDDDLDSDDDDLQPYDMSNDTPIVEDKRPRYLQDIREALLETDDFDVFEQTMISSASLIELRLPHDDSKIGVELLRIFIEIDDRFHVNDFDFHRMSCCVAICCIKPKDSSEFLCKQIHSELGRYSIGKKVLMMEILAESAKSLAKLTKPKEKPPQPIVPPVKRYTLKLGDDDDKAQLIEARRIVKERLEKKTRRFAHPSTSILHGGTTNKFSDVAGSFFFPLLYGIGKDELKMHGMNNALKDDTDNILLLNLLRTIGTITFACENCPIITRVTPEVLQLGFALRFHAEPKIRLAVLQMLAAALLATPKSLLQLHFSAHLIEMKDWLEEYLSFNIIKGEKNEECRRMAQSLLALCFDALIADV